MNLMIFDAAVPGVSSILASYAVTIVIALVIVIAVVAGSAIVLCILLKKKKKHNIAQGSGKTSEQENGQ